MIGLLSKHGSYAIDTLVAAGNLPLAAVELSDLDLPPYECPYGLPTVRRGDTLVVVSGWLHSLSERGIDPIKRALIPLREKFSRIIGVDHADPFLLSFSEQIISHMDVVLKVNGVYRDMDLYNYVVGAPTPNGRWTEKIRLREEVYSPAQIEKIRPLFPCFIGTAPALRALIRRFYCPSPSQRIARSLGDAVYSYVPRLQSSRRVPKRTVHFYASLNHGQRLQAVQLIRDSCIPWRGGITSIPNEIAGFGQDGIKSLSAAEHEAVVRSVQDEGLAVKPLGRLTYQVAMQDCKAVLSVTGYGEICFRMAEAWANKRVLVCQDLSHAHIEYPLESQRNVVYCQPNLTDLIEVLEDIECNYKKYISIAEQGYEDWRAWLRGIDPLLRRCFGPLYDNT